MNKEQSPKPVSALMSAELQHLLVQARQVKSWIADVEQKIVELETSYLEESSMGMGNIVRGWDVDLKPVAGRARAVDDKERVFSQSSYKVWLGNKAVQETAGNKRTLESAVEIPPKSKKLRKSVSRKSFGGADDNWVGDF
jgi:hypothetical protein